MDFDCQITSRFLNETSICSDICASALGVLAIEDRTLAVSSEVGRFLKGNSASYVFYLGDNMYSESIEALLSELAKAGKRLEIWFWRKSMSSWQDEIDKWLKLGGNVIFIRFLDEFLDRSSLEHSAVQRSSKPETYTDESSLTDNDDRPDIYQDDDNSVSNVVVAAGAGGEGEGDGGGGGPEDGSVEDNSMGFGDFDVEDNLLQVDNETLLPNRVHIMQHKPESIECRGVTIKMFREMASAALRIDSEKSNWTVDRLTHELVGSKEIASTHNRWTVKDPLKTFSYDPEAKVGLALIDSLKTKHFHDRHPHFESKYGEVVGGKANVFVSFSYNSNYFDLLDTIEVFLSDCSDTKEETEVLYFWFDPFVNNQWVVTEKSFEWWTVAFQTAIKSIGHTLLVLSPWRDPAPLKRAWCLYEIFCTAMTNSKLSIVLSSKDKEIFFEDMSFNGIAKIHSMLATVDLAKSTSRSEEDVRRIHEAVRGTVGMDALNTVVVSQLRSWMMQVTRKSIASATATERANVFELKKTLASLCKLESKYDDARGLFAECLTSQLQSATRTSEDYVVALVCLNDLASVCGLQRHYHLAEPLLLECFRRRRDYFGDLDPSTLRSLNNLGNHYFIQEKYDLAQAIFIDCLRKRRMKIGAGHPDTISTINNLALVFSKLGYFEWAIYLFEECLEKRKKILGPYHLSVAATKKNIGDISARLGNFKYAEELFLDSLQQRSISLGDKHVITITTRKALAALKNRSIIKISSTLLRNKEAELFEFLYKCVNFVPDKCEICGSFALNVFQRHFVSGLKKDWQFADVDIFIAGSPGEFSDITLVFEEEVKRFESKITEFGYSIEFKEIKYFKEESGEDEFVEVVGDSLKSSPYRLIDYTIAGIPFKISLVNMENYSSTMEVIKSFDLSCCSMKCTLSSLDTKLDGTKEFVLSFSHAVWTKHDLVEALPMWIGTGIDAKSDCLNGVLHVLKSKYSTVRCKKYLNRGFKMLLFNSDRICETWEDVIAKKMSNTLHTVVVDNSNGINRKKIEIAARSDEEYDEDEDYEELFSFKKINKAPNNIKLLSRRSAKHEPSPAPSPPTYVKFSGSGNSTGVVFSESAFIFTAADLNVLGSSICDDSRPNTLIQIKQAQGPKKLRVKMNLDATVADLAKLASELSGGLPFVLSAGFPPVDLIDASLSIENAGLKGTSIILKTI